MKGGWLLCQSNFVKKEIKILFGVKSFSLNFKDYYLAANGANLIILGLFLFIFVVFTNIISTSTI